MQIAVKNQNGDSLDSIELNDAVFNVPMNTSLVHQAMVIYQGNKRQGTHDTKTWCTKDVFMGSLDSIEWNWASLPKPF